MISVFLEGDSEGRDHFMMVAAPLSWVCSLAHSWVGGSGAFPTLSSSRVEMWRAPTTLRSAYKSWDVVSSSIPPEVSTNEKPGLLLITGKGLMKHSVFHDSFASAGTLSPPRKRAFSWVRQSSEPPVPAELAVQVSLQCCSSCIKNILRIA